MKKVLTIGPLFAALLCQSACMTDENSENTPDQVFYNPDGPAAQVALSNHLLYNVWGSNVLTGYDYTRRATCQVRATEKEFSAAYWLGNDIWEEDFFATPSEMVTLDIPLGSASGRYIHYDVLDQWFAFEPDRAVVEMVIDGEFDMRIDCRRLPAGPL